MNILNRLFCYILILLVAASMASCASRLAIKTVQRPAQYDAPFSFNGRVAIKRGLENSAAGLRWVHNPEEDEDEVLILEPLGKIIARIHRDAQGATLEAQGRFYVAQDVESLTLQVLGWTMPLKGLTHWVVALPAKASAADIQRDSKKQITLMRQDGWEMRYVRYTGKEPDSLPAKIVMRKDQMEMTVVIDEWEKQHL